MICLKLQENERAVYDSFYGESQAEFMSMARADVMKNYVNILQKILRLRQICDDVELMKGSKDGARYDCAAQFEEAILAIEKDGINLERASAIFALQRETLTAQCAECGMELASLPSEGGADAATDGDDVTTNGKRGKKSKAATSASGTRSSSECPTIHPIVTRCTHLYCLCCFRAKVCADWPRVSPEVKGNCSICQLEIFPAVDAIEVRSDGMDLKKKDGADTNVKKPKRVKGEPILNYRPSSKIIALLQELLPLSRANPYSANYDPTEADEVQELDNEGKRIEKGVVKSVVLYVEMIYLF
jgi:SWI/SNF-related matrix-associated actin-dependent regulator of chromatin subfamily A3